MSINGNPKFSDVPPLHRHFLYGVNCYQYAIGHRPVTVFTDAANPNRYAYQTLCPGDFAEKASRHGTGYIGSYALKKLILEGCHEDGLIELEQRSIHAAINVPEGMRLLAYHFTEGNENGMGDFDFAVFNPKTHKWENKTPFAPTKESDSLKPIEAGGYVFQRFFLAKEGLIPKGKPEGIVVPVDDQLTLNFVAHPPHWAKGPSLQDIGDALFLRRQCPVYAKPDWPVVKPT